MKSNLNKLVKKKILLMKKCCTKTNIINPMTKFGGASVEINPSIEVIDDWIENYVPVKDLFFLSQEPSTFTIDFKDVLVIPENEFFNHDVYKQLHYMNSYEYWNIKNVLYVIVAEKDWIELLPKDKKKLILHEQVKCHRGLIFPLTFFEHMRSVPHEYIIEEQIVIQRAMWEQWT